MKRFALPLYAGFIAYFLASILLGPASPASMRALGEERARIQANLEELERLNGEYVRRIEALRSDGYAQALEARSLGYLEPGERMIHVEGLPSRKRFAVAGRIIAFRESVSPARALALPVGISVFALAALASAVAAKEGAAQYRTRRAR